MNLINRLKNILFEPHSTLRYWLFIKLNFDNIYKKKFQKNFKILDFFVNLDKGKKMYSPQFHDLNNLIVTIQKLKPVSVLEFGGGYSTIAIAYALSENFKKFQIKGKLYSYDQSNDYLDLTKSIMPKHLEKFVDFHYSELVLDKIDEIDVSLFKNLEIKKYDLIYEDRYDAHIRQTVCGDILLLIKKTNHVPSIIFDGHWKSVFFHKRKFKSLYNISISKVFKRANFIKK